MEKIAICVPTFNRPLVIRELILKCYRYFENLDYDLYIYDSSDNDETWSVCKNLRLNYKFKYIHADRKIHSNEKVYKIYQDHNLLENYNYIWVWSDSIRWSEDILYKVKRTEDYDLVILNHRDKENIGDKIYNNPQQIFEDLAWEMTLYGSTIVNTDRILRGVQWNKYENAFLLSECINFSHICLYFERMMEVKNIKVLHYSIDSSEFTVSSLKEESGWYNNIFFIWWECWYNAINKLDGYINKEYVIRKLGIMSGYFTVKGMLILRQKGKYSLKVFIKYLERINYVTDISFFKMFLMAIMPIKLASYCLKLNCKNLIIDIETFQKKYNKLYIYGCGCNAKIVANKFKEWGINYEGFCVTIKENDFFMGKKVEQFSSSLLNDSDVGIVLGMNKKNSCQVIEAYFKENELQKRVFCDFNDYWEQLFNE